MKTAVSVRLRVSLRVVWFLTVMAAALLPQPVNGQSSIATTTTVVPSAGTITLGGTVTLTATVSTTGGGTPTGQVTFFDGPTPIGTGPVLTPGVSSAASFSTSLLSAAASPHSVTAVYHGDATFSPSTSSAISVTVQLRTSATGVVLNPTTVVVGQPSTATVTLTDSGSVPPGTADTFAATGAPATGRTAFSATLFADGRVLVAGGVNSTGTVLNTAEIYSISGAGFTAAGNLNTARTGAVAVLLPNGKVLVAGGSSNGTPNGALNTAELFDPKTGTFIATANNMNAARFGTSAILLNNGKVLLARGENSGGVLNSAELYDPTADTFTATGNLSAARAGAAATLLGTGKVLLAGGSSDGTANGALNNAELFDPSGNSGAGTFTAITGANSNLTNGRWQAEAALLLSGKVLIAGGQDSGGALASADLYDPAANTFSPSNHAMAQARSNGSAIALPNGMVLLAGGTTAQAVDLYDADSDIYDATGSLQQSDNGLVGILLNNGQVLVIGLTSGGTPASDAELYSPSFNPLGTVAVTSSEVADSFPGACVLIPSSSTASNCTSTVIPSNPPTSPHTITGTFPADAIHSGSSNTASLTVNKTNSATAVTSSANPAVLSQSVIFTATVTAVAPGGGTPTGTVVFLDGGSPIGFGTLSGGVATFTISASSLGLGNHPITTNYGGDSNFNGSIGTLTGTPQVVNKASSSTLVTSSANPAVLGQSVTFTATVTPVAPGSGTPTGTVVILDGGSPVGFGTLSGGVTTFTTSALGLGNHAITTSYSGDSTFNGSIGTLTGTPQVVNKANSAIAVTSSLNPSVVTQSVTFTATVSAVAPGSGTPSGSVTFLDGGNSIGTGTLSSGVATFSTSALALGNHTITTSYAGDSSFNSSAGSLTGNPQVVTKPNTTTSVTSSLNPSVFGQSVTFTATVSVVAPGVGTATGTVTFFDGGTSIGTGTLSGGVATLTTSALAGGNHTITTSYPGDSNFGGNTGSLTGNPQVVNKANSTMTVASSLNPSVFGQSITFTATVSAVAPGAGTATGTVTFLSGGSSIGTGTLSGGVATLITSTVTVGIHTITASYGGDSNFNSSTGSLLGNPQIVSKSDSVTALTSSANPTVLGQSVSFTATITAVAPGGGTPTGTVTFLDGGSPIGTGTLSGGVATFTTSALGLGNHPITTSYGGDSNFNGSIGTLTGTPQVVNKANSATAVASSLNPSVFGQLVTFTATIAAVAPGSGTPTGTVIFLDNGSPIGVGTLSGGVATFSTSALALGNHPITTSYGGDSNFNGSTGSLTGNPQVVGKPGSTTTLTSSRNPSALGQSVTFTATVSATPPGSGTPTGTVNFLDSGTSIGSATLSSGVATLTISTLAAGNHTITASYAGDANFNGGAGSLTGNPQIVVGPPGIAKAFTPTVILPNGTSVLTITLTNPSANTAALAGVAFTDTFPANLIVATPNAVANTCGGTPVAAAGSSSIALTGGSIPVNGSCAVSVNVTSAANGAYVNTTGAVSSTNGGTGATASSTLSVASPPAISQVFGAASIALSGSTSLAFTLANPAANSIPLTGVAFTDSLPSGLQVASPNGLTGTCGGGTITAAAGSSSVALSSASLPVSGSCTIAVNVTGTALGVQNNSVTVTSSNGGTGNTSSASLNVVPPDFSVSMAGTSESVKAGQPAAFTFTIGPANGVAVPTTVTLSVSGLPPNSTGSFLSASVTPGSTSITDTLVITTTPSVPYLTQNFGRNSSDSERASLYWWPSDTSFLRPGGSSFNPLFSALTCLLILGLSLSGFGGRRWLRVRATGLCLLLLLCVAFGGIGLAGCASAQKLQTLGTPAGTYSLIVTATLATPSGNVQHSTTITLTVLP